MKVKKSQEGDLLWMHGEEMVQGSEPHYTYANSSKTELEIYDAGPEQAGIYEVLIKKGRCEIRKEIEVRILGLHYCSCLWSKTVLKVVFLDICFINHAGGWKSISSCGTGDKVA